MKKIFAILAFTAVTYAADTQSEFDPIAFLNTKKANLEYAVTHPNETPEFEQGGVIVVTREQANAMNQQELGSINYCLSQYATATEGQDFVSFLNTRKMILEQALSHPNETPEFEQNGIILVTHEQANTINQQELGSINMVLSMLSGPSIS